MSLGPVMLDIDGVSLTPADRDLLREPAVGNRLGNHDGDVGHARGEFVTTRGPLGVSGEVGATAGSSGNDQVVSGEGGDVGGS